MRKLFIVFFIFSFFNLYAQNVPWSLHNNYDLKNSETFVLSEFDKYKLLEQDHYDLFRKSFSFAKAFDVDVFLDNSFSINDTENVVIKKIIATEADGLSFVFETNNDFLKGEFFIFDSNYNYIINHKFDSTQKVYSTPFLPDDTVYVEYHFYDSFDVKISKIGAAYRDLKDGSDWCEVNINCDSNQLWQTLKHSIVKIIFEGDNNVYYACTGNLVANTKLNSNPYVLTANHCISTQTEAQNAVFYFNYEALSCDSTEGHETQFISGSDLIATANDHLDFSLLQLSVVPPKVYKPYYMGWSLTHEYSDTTVCIHHPAGDIKKISYNYLPLGIGSFEGYDGNKHWWVQKWGQGTTEGGSSGAGLLTKEGLLIGVLSGGDASCDNNVDDFFQQFYHCWDDYNTFSKQLRHWLNPYGFSIDKMEGYDPYLNDYLNVPTGLTVELYDSLAVINWNAALGNPDKYILYRNLKKVQEFTFPQTYSEVLTKDDVYAYYVTAVWGNSESKPSNIETVVFGDTSRIPKVTSIKVFPNPTTGNVNIYTPDSNAIQRIDIIDISGRVIQTKKFQVETKVNFHLDGLKPSCYILRLTTIGQVYYKKIVFVD